MKKILLIMPNFFDYPQAICDELEHMGYEVDFFDDRPSTNGFIKALIRINKSLIGLYIAQYFEKVMKIVRGKKYDIVFLISGQSLSFSEAMIKQLKDEQPQAQYVLYQWDSLKNFPFIKKIEPYFDRCYSFDRVDVMNNTNLQFLPLFYTKRYEEIGNLNKNHFLYDFCFIGTAHPKKYKFITMMSEQLKKIYPNQFIYFYFPSRLVFLYRKFVNPELKKAKYSEFHFDSLNGKEMFDIYSESNCVLDSPQAGQFGLTIRVIEALGAQKKLITTNEDVINYDFYSEDNIYVYDGKSFDFDSPFFKNPYKKIDQCIYEKYSLRSWLKEMKI